MLYAVQCYHAKVQKTWTQNPTYLYRPFEHVRHAVVPAKLLVPVSHFEQFCNNPTAFPTHPAGHCLKPVHDVTLSLLMQCLTLMYFAGLLIKMSVVEEADEHAPSDMLAGYRLRMSG